MTVLNALLGVLIFLLVITLSIALHEAGHMAVAKTLGIPVPRFFVGFGPTLWSTQRGETEYGIKGIPLGGFIQVEDTTQPEGSPERSLLSHVAPWKRFLVFVAGPAVNLVLGVAILFGLLVTTPVEYITTTVGTVNACSNSTENCAAQKAGILPGDKIVRVDGKTINSMDDLYGKFRASGSEVVVLRKGKELTLHAVGNQEGRIGVSMTTEQRKRGAGESLSMVGTFFKMNLEAVAKLPDKVPNVAKAIMGQEERSQDSVSSIVGIGKAYSDTTSSQAITIEDKTHTLILYTALMNIGLGIANLLPLMPLDGGRILIACIDSIKLRVDKLRKRTYVPLSYKWVSAMTAITGVILIGFMLLVIVADVVAPISTM